MRGPYRLANARAAMLARPHASVDDELYRQLAFENISSYPVTQVTIYSPHWQLGATFSPFFSF